MVGMVVTVNIGPYNARHLGVERLLDIVCLSSALRAQWGGDWRVLNKG